MAKAVVRRLLLYVYSQSVIDDQHVVFSPVLSSRHSRFDRRERLDQLPLNQARRSRDARQPTPRRRCMLIHAQPDVVTSPLDRAPRRAYRWYTIDAVVIYRLLPPREIMC